MPPVGFELETKYLSSIILFLAIFFLTQFGNIFLPGSRFFNLILSFIIFAAVIFLASSSSTILATLSNKSFLTACCPSFYFILAYLLERENGLVSQCAPDSVKSPIFLCLY